MRTIETTAVVAADRTLTLTLPADAPTGPVRLTLTLEANPGAEADDKPFPYNLEMIPWGDWPEGFSASREQIYGNDGR